MINYFNNKLLGFFVKTNGYFSRLIFSGIGHIIMLHRVLPESPFEIPENKALEITPSNLEKLILFYKRQRYSFVSLDTLYKILIGEEKTKTKVAILTFDDGYIDFYNYALPLLSKHKIHYNIYITTGYQNNIFYPWWYMIDILLKFRNEVIINDGQVKQVIKCLTSDEKQIVFKHIRKIILKNYRSYTHFIETIFHDNSENLFKRQNEFNAANFLSWAQIIEISRDPLACIGAHTVSHAILNRLSDKEIINEVIYSKEAIESKIGKEVVHFAYPHGGIEEVGQREFEILKKMPFKTCTTTRQSNLFKGHKTHMECLPRIFINNNTTDEKLINNLNGISQFQKNKWHRIVT